MVSGNNFHLQATEIHILQLFTQDSAEKCEEDLFTLDTITQVALSLHLIYVSMEALHDANVQAKAITFSMKQ